jgi:hypothetical protein
MGCLHVGRRGDFDVLNKAKRKFKCWLTELKCCREDIAVQEDY